MAQKSHPGNKPPAKRAPQTTVIRGKAAAAEMKAMQREAKQQQVKAKRS